MFGLFGGRKDAHIEELKKRIDAGIVVGEMIRTDGWKYAQEVLDEMIMNSVHVCEILENQYPFLYGTFYVCSRPPFR